MKSFTDTYIKSLKSSNQKYEKYVGAGFGIRVTPKGTKSWIYRYKIGNKTSKLTLGHYPTMSLSQASARFYELKGIRQDGLDPKAVIQQKEDKDNNTVEKRFDQWYQNYILGTRKQPKQILQHIEKNIKPALGHIKLDELQAIDISRALDEIVNRGARVHANKVLGTIKQALNFAVSRGYISSNPAQSIRARDIGGLEKPRTRVLSLDEVKTLWSFLDSKHHNLSLPVSHMLKILLLTGVRSGELRLATWDEIDFSKSLWTIPADRTKTSVVMHVHLSPLVTKLLCELKETNTSKFVISAKDDLPLSEKALPRAVKRIWDRVGIPHWTAHDLRRTFATQLSEALHIDPVVIEKCLGHKMPKIMATYNQNEMLPQRQEVLDRWSKYIYSLLSQKVIPIMPNKSGNL